MKLFLLGAPCAGKTTVTTALRQSLPFPVLDMDEELVKLNGGSWPAFDIKRDLVLQVVAEASLLDDVILAHSILDDEGLALLEAHGWCVVLMDLPEAVMRERAAIRELQEGWSNIEWLPTHLENIAHLKEEQVFTHLLDATGSPHEVGQALVRLMVAAPS